MSEYCKNCFELAEKVTKKERECNTLKSQLDFAVQQKECFEQECEELKERNALLESQMAFNLGEMEIRLGDEVNRSETLLKELKRFDKIKDAFREMSEELKIKNTRYRKALEEIENNINKYFEEAFYKNCRYAKGCTNACGLVTNSVLNKILDIINKAKGEEDER